MTTAPSRSVRPIASRGRAGATITVSSPRGWRLSDARLNRRDRRAGSSPGMATIQRRKKRSAARRAGGPSSTMPVRVPAAWLQKAENASLSAATAMSRPPARPPRRAPPRSQRWDRRLGSPRPRSGRERKVRYIETPGAVAAIAVTNAARRSGRNPWAVRPQATAKAASPGHPNSRPMQPPNAGAAQPPARPATTPASKPRPARVSRRPARRGAARSPSRRDTREKPVGATAARDRRVMTSISTHHLLMPGSMPSPERPPEPPPAVPVGAAAPRPPAPTRGRRARTAPLHGHREPRCGLCRTPACPYAAPDAVDRRCRRPGRTAPRSDHVSLPRSDSEEPRQESDRPWPAPVLQCRQQLGAGKKERQLDSRVLGRVAAVDRIALDARAEQMAQRPRRGPGHVRRAHHLAEVGHGVLAFQGDRHHRPAGHELHQAAVERPLLVDLIERPRLGFREPKHFDPENCKTFFLQSCNHLASVAGSD